MCFCKKFGLLFDPLNGAMIKSRQKKWRNYSIAPYNRIKGYMMQQQNWDILPELIGRFPQGASLEEIMLELNSAVPRRTLQRWLSILVKNGVLAAMGKGRARRYALSSIAHGKSLKPSMVIPVSSEGKKIQSLVSQPIQKRGSVGYHRNFLERYSPNCTYYLSEKLRHKFLFLGGSEKVNDPAGTYARQIFHRLLIDLSWNSSRLEGNTYSLLETEKLLECGNAAEGKDLKETQMILNHKAAIEFLIDSADQIGVYPK